jgi:hypothetical protein
MDTSQHDESPDTGSSRPADPDVVARESGKVTPERSSENPGQRPPSQPRRRGQPSDDEPTERRAGDLLVGAALPRAPRKTRHTQKTADPYYLKTAPAAGRSATPAATAENHRQQAPAASTLTS